MEEQIFVLRQLIAQLQEIMHHYGSPPPNQPPFFPTEEHYRRCCIPYIEEGSSDDCHDLTTTSDKNSEKFKMAETLSPPAKRSKKDRNHGNSSAEETSKDETMDQKIWQDFPEDLFEAVLARLPITTFFRFRTVCRLWNSMVESESFSQHCSLRNPQSMPWFYIITNLYPRAVYDPSSNKWYYPTKPSIPRETIIPVASAGGLVCFSGICHKKYYVSNPFTQSVRELPAGSLKVRYNVYVVVGMILNGKSTREGYKVVMVKHNGEYQVYDSLTNSWTRRGSLPLSIEFPISLNYRSQPVSIGTKFYFLLSRPEGIMSYDVVSDSWKHLFIPAPLQTGDHMLTECNGRIMLIGLLTKNAASCVSVWELQKMTLLWEEVDRMPNLMCLEFYGKNLRMSCLGNKGCLVMLSLRTLDISQLVMYNLATKEWAQVIGSVALPPGSCQWIESGTAFHPSPTATA